MNELPVYVAVCDRCEWHMCLMNQNVIQYHAEAHMMETGHICLIKELS